MGKIEKTITYDFWGHSSNDGKEYHKILSGCSMGSKYLLNFTCLPMKFHNCHHINWHLFDKFPQRFFPSLLLAAIVCRLRWCRHLWMIYLVFLIRCFLEHSFTTSFLMFLWEVLERENIQNLKLLVNVW